MSSLKQITALAVSAGILLAGVPSAQAAGTMSMTLAPHCTEQDRTKCPLFETVDATTIKTGRLAAGDILDVDVVVTGPDFAKVRSVSAWLSYDTASLEARSVELTPELPAPTPGEQTIDPVQKLVKIGGGTDKGLSGPNVAVARVTFRVTSALNDTIIRFDSYLDSGAGHTAVNGDIVPPGQEEGALPQAPCIDSIIGCQGTPEPLLMAEPAKLSVTLKDPSAPATQSSSVSSSAAMQSSVSSTSTVSSAGSTASVFTVLQVQGVQVTTRDTELFLGWQALKSAELAGYNVYYGTVSGRYIQRRSVPSTATSLVIRDLEPGATYYLAVRGVNAQNQESVFSQEVSVTIGKPESATSPMVGGSVPPTQTGDGTTPYTGSAIGGETGIGDSVAILLLLSAGIGTFFAFRRQMILSSAHAV